MADVRISFPKPCDEPWAEMTPAGCDRVCGRCARTIHDLRHYSIEEVEALVRRDPDTCVRASVATDGTVTLKRGGTRRMIATIGATVALLASPHAVSAKEKKPRGTIAGRVADVDWSTKVVATGSDGTTYRAKVEGDGRYAIKHLPAGSYRLVFTPSCGEPWIVDSVVVADDAAVNADTKDPNQCIIVGMVRIEDDNG